MPIDMDLQRALHLVLFFSSGAVLSVSLYCQRLSVASIASKNLLTF